MTEAAPGASLEEFPVGLWPSAAAEVVGSALEQGAPLLLRGACDRARAKWTDAWLIALFEGRDCNVTVEEASEPAGVRDPAKVRRLGVLRAR